MEIKKDKNKQVERHNGLYIEIGLLIALLIVFSAFKWRSSPPDYTLDTPFEDTLDDGILPPITAEPIEKPKPPEPKPEPIVNKIIKPSIDLTFVPNEVEIEYDTTSIDLNIDELEAYTLYGDGVADTILEPQPPELLSQQPSYPGGIAELHKFLRNNIVYPEWEKQYGIGGTVYLKFTIDKKGNVRNVGVVKGATPGINKEALRVAKKIPQWTPGLQNGKPVKCWFMQRIVFKTAY